MSVRVQRGDDVQIHVAWTGKTALLPMPVKLAASSLHVLLAQSHPRVAWTWIGELSLAAFTIMT